MYIREAHCIDYGLIYCLTPDIDILALTLQILLNHNANVYLHLKQLKFIMIMNNVIHSMVIAPSKMFLMNTLLILTSQFYIKCYFY